MNFLEEILYKPYRFDDVRIVYFKGRQFLSDLLYAFLKRGCSSSLRILCIKADIFPATLSRTKSLFVLIAIRGCRWTPSETKITFAKEPIVNIIVMLGK